MINADNHTAELFAIKSFDSIISILLGQILKNTRKRGRLSIILRNGGSKYHSPISRVVAINIGK